LRVGHTPAAQGADSYVWDVGVALPVILKDNGNTFVYGLDLISATDGAGTQTYYLYDGLGSTVDLTNTSGNSTQSYSYDAFGATQGGPPPGTNQWLFTGEQRDVDSGLYYLRARYYDPAIGRFLGRDPIMAAEPYAYVGNNPVTWVDPSGLCAFGAPCPVDDAVDCVTDPIDCAQDASEEVKTHAKNKINATGHYFQTVDQNPSTFPQETLGLGIAWTSLGDYHVQNGVGWWDNCWGSCSWLELVSAGAFAMGHNVFAEERLFRCERVHELVHVSDSREHGASWLAHYVWELINNGYRENQYEVRAYAAQARCERQGKE
jgi:RHS repeat-associated protein